MILHVTDKLRKKLHLPALQRVDESTGAHLRWYGNVFTADRAQYILTTNAASLFSVVVFGRGITDDSKYILRFLSALRDHMEDLDLQHIYQQAFVAGAGAVSFAKTIDRSVLGSMNDMVSICRHRLTLDDVSPWDLSKDLNDTPFGAIEYQYPQKVFRGMAADTQV